MGSDSASPEWSELSLARRKRAQSVIETLIKEQRALAANFRANAQRKVDRPDPNSISYVRTCRNQADIHETRASDLEALLRLAKAVGVSR